MNKLSFPKNKIKVLLLEGIHSGAADLFRDEAFNVQELKSALSEKELSEKIKDIHILGIRSKTQVTAENLEKASNLLVLGTFCIGTNQVDLLAAAKKGIPVFNAPYSNTRSVAEWVISNIISLARKLGDRNKEMHQGTWKKMAKDCHEVRLKSLGIIGYGHIGSQVSILAEALGMRIFYYDIMDKLALGNATPVSSMKELLAKCDFISLHVPQTEETNNLFTKNEFKQMKEGAYLLNASRGSVVQLDDLADSIKTGHLAGAAIDVYSEEPVGNTNAYNSPLLGLPNVILSPHIGGSTMEAQKNIAIEVAGKLIRFINNGSTSSSVNVPGIELPCQKGYHRILNIHKNVPGFLSSVNSIISNLGANIHAQYLATNTDIGFLIVDLDIAVSDKIKKQIAALDYSLKTRILY